VTETVLGASARLETRGQASWWRSPALAHPPDVVHGVTHASLGNFSLSVGDDGDAVRSRRRELLAAAGLRHARVVAPALHHTAAVAVARDGELPRGKFDAVVTDDPRVVLAVTVADCVPVFLLDAETASFGVAHAGWRGLAGGIVRRAVEAMREAFDVRPGNLLVATGPAIRGPSYEVGPEVWGLFPEPFAVPAGDPAEGRARLDLPSCALADAAGAGVPRDNLVDFSLDTATHPDALFSHRRGDRSRHWAFIGRP
jgi:YfiH family protein